MRLISWSVITDMVHIFTWRRRPSLCGFLVTHISFIYICYIFVKYFVIYYLLYIIYYISYIHLKTTIFFWFFGDSYHWYGSYICLKTTIFMWFFGDLYLIFGDSYLFSRMSSPPVEVEEAGKATIIILLRVILIVIFNGVSK